MQKLHQCLPVTALRFYPLVLNLMSVCIQTSIDFLLRLQWKLTVRVVHNSKALKGTIYGLFFFLP